MQRHWADNQVSAVNRLMFAAGSFSFDSSLSVRDLKLGFDCISMLALAFAFFFIVRLPCLVHLSFTPLLGCLLQVSCTVTFDPEREGPQLGVSASAIQLLNLSRC